MQIDPTTEKLGYMAMWSQYLLIGLGKPHQIFIMWQTQSSEGVSIIMNLIILLSCLLWGIYGVRIKNPVIWKPQVLAIPLMLIITATAVYYG